MVINDFNKFNQIIQSLNLKNKGRIIALDVGSKRIGVASCDDQRIFVLPKLIITRKSNLIDFQKIKEIIIETNAEIIVIGYPLDQDNQQNNMTNFIEKFANNLDQFLDQEFNKSFLIILFDERYSSFTARMINHQYLKSNKSKKFYDDVSASLILEHFLLQVNQS